MAVPTESSPLSNTPRPLLGRTHTSPPEGDVTRQLADTPMSPQANARVPPTARSSLSSHHDPKGTPHNGSVSPFIPASLPAPATLLGLPSELRELIWNRLPYLALVNVSRSCEIFRVESAAQLCAQVGRYWNGNFFRTKNTGETSNEDMPGGPEYFREFRKRTKALYIRREVLESREALEKVLTLYNDAELEHLIFEAFSSCPIEASKPLAAFTEKQQHLKVAVAPRVINAEQVAGGVTLLGSIFETRRAKMQSLMVIAHRNSSLDLVRRLNTRPRQQVTELRLFGAQIGHATIDEWASTLAAQGLEAPLTVPNMEFHFCNLAGLSAHMELKSARSLRLINCAFDHDSTNSLNAFISWFVDKKIAIGETQLDEFFHTSFVKTINSASAGGITSENIERISTTATEVKTFSVQQDSLVALSPPDIIARWGSSLHVFSWKYKQQVMDNETIANLCSRAPLLESIGFFSQVSETLSSLYGIGKYRIRIKHAIQEFTENLATAFKSGGGFTKLKTILLFSPSLLYYDIIKQHGRHIAALMEAVSDIIMILKQHDISIERRTYISPTYSFRTDDASLGLVTYLREFELTPHEQRLLFKLGGSSDICFHHFAETLMPAESPRRETREELMAIKKEKEVRQRRQKEELERKRKAIEIPEKVVNKVANNGAKRGKRGTGARGKKK
ncbi:hypothetical protein N0V90_004607 [Kalmusia sp. IMI 367209]|nr:hypothetical protein N0V90_004607 [Kalmusia sp. IMI 367209]